MPVEKNVNRINMRHEEIVKDNLNKMNYMRKNRMIIRKYSNGDETYEYHIFIPFTAVNEHIEIKKTFLFISLRYFKDDKYRYDFQDINRDHFGYLDFYNENIVSDNFISKVVIPLLKNNDVSLKDMSAFNSLYKLRIANSMVNATNYLENKSLSEQSTENFVISSDDIGLFIDERKK